INWHTLSQYTNESEQDGEGVARNELRGVTRFLKASQRCHLSEAFLVGTKRRIACESCHVGTLRGDDGDTRWNATATGRGADSTRGRRSWSFPSSWRSREGFATS